jgi:hypothetical protein
MEFADQAAAEAEVARLRAVVADHERQAGVWQAAIERIKGEAHGDVKKAHAARDQALAARDQAIAAKQA